MGRQLFPTFLDLVGRRMYHLFRNDEAGVTWLQSNKLWFSPQAAAWLRIVGITARAD